MKKNFLFLLIVLICFCSACAPKSPKTEDDSLTLLTTGINYEKFMDALNEKYPDLKINFLSYTGYNQTGYILETMEAGELPDIVTTTYFVDQKLQQERLLDLSKYSFVNNYSDAWLNECNVDGNIYLLPSNYSAVGFYYNKTIMDQYGWQLPSNFEELKELAAEIKKAGLDVCCARMDLEGFVFSYLFGLGNTFFFNTEKGDLWKKEFLTGESNAAGNLEPVLAYFKEWVDEGFIQEKDINSAAISNHFFSGNTVFMLCNGFAQKELYIDDVGKMEYGVLPWLGREGESNMIVSSVSRYYGINKKLGEKGNEQKLENALKVMEFMASDEGMKLLKTETNSISPLNTVQITEDEMNYEIKDYITGGNTIPLVYAGWDELIIPMAQELYKLLRGEQEIEECARAFDEIRDLWLQKGPLSFGIIENYVEQETAAKLVGYALIEELEADAALISLGDYHGFGRENQVGVQCGIYPGNFTLDRMRTIVPSGRQALVTMKGEEILRRKETGKFVKYKNMKEGEENIPFSYILVTKDGEPLQKDQDYKLVVSQSDLTKEELALSHTIFIAVETQKYMENFLGKLEGNLTELINEIEGN